MSSPEKPEGMNPELWEFATRDWKGAIFQQAERLNQLKIKINRTQNELQDSRKESQKIEQTLTSLIDEEKWTMFLLKIICQMQRQEEPETD